MRHDYPIDEHITLHPRFLIGDQIPYRYGEQILHAEVRDIGLHNGHAAYLLDGLVASLPRWVPFRTAHRDADIAGVAA